MHKYYCKNCNNIVGEWNNYCEFYNFLSNCYFIKSKNTKMIDFLNCKNCDKFVGILCYDVCINCFGKNEIYGEENLFNFFFKYKKIVPEDLNNCKICNNKYNFRCQYWFFEELTFYKQ